MSTAIVPLVHGEAIHGTLVLSRIGGSPIDGSERSLFERMGAALGRLYWIHDQLAWAGREQTEAFVRLLAHEIRNPLGVAMAAVDQVDDEDNEEAIERINNALSGIDGIVDTFLSIAKSDGVDETTRRDFGATAEAAWTEVGVDSARLFVTDSFPIEADHQLLTRLFSNLFQNAIRHGGADVTVVVGGSENGFYVEDDGPGIPPEERERVVQWGYSANDGELGLGLSFVQSIVEAHDWELAITDSDIGGARFEISGIQTGSDPPPPD